MNSGPDERAEVEMSEMSERQRQELLRVVERIALVMAETGMPRMAARVYAYVLSDDDDRYTAKDLATGLGVSLAAVSGAVNYLSRIGVIERQREPGSRADTYVINDDDLWSQVLTARSMLVARWEDAVAEGADRLGDTPGGRRLRESQWFFEFLRHDLETMAERWHSYRSAPASQVGE